MYVDLCWLVWTPTAKPLHKKTSSTYTVSADVTPQSSSSLTAPWLESLQLLNSFCVSHSKRQGIRLAKDTRSDTSQQRMTSHIGQHSHKALLNKHAACPTQVTLSENSITYDRTQHQLNCTFSSTSCEGAIFWRVLSVWFAATACPVAPPVLPAWIHPPTYCSVKSHWATFKIELILLKLA